MLRHEAPRSQKTATAGLEQAAEKPLTPEREFVQTLVQNRGNRSGHSETFKALVLGFAALVGAKADSIDSVLEGVPSIESKDEARVQKRGVAQSLEQHDGPAHVEAHGSQEFIGIQDEVFAAQVVDIMRPLLLSGATYRVHVLNEQRRSQAQYFGHQRAHGHFMQHAHVVGRTIIRSGSQDFRIELYTAGLRDYRGDENNFRTFMETFVHELIHTRTEEGLGYFLDRVHSEDRIRFPYSEAFLAGHPHGEGVRWTTMAEEYRSELIACFFHARMPEANETFEQVVSEMILERFPGSSPRAILEDIRAVQAWRSDVHWPELLKRYHGTTQQWMAQYQTSLLNRRFVEPLHDEGLQGSLRSILQSNTYSALQDLFTEGANTATEPERRKLLIEMRAYQNMQIEGYEQQIRALGHNAVPLFEQWKGIIHQFARTAHWRNKRFMHQFTRDAVASSQMDFSSGMAYAPREFIDRWNALSATEKNRLRPLFEEAAPYIAGTFIPPAEYTERLKTVEPASAR